MALYIKYAFIRFKDRITVYITVIPFACVPFPVLLACVSSV